MHFVSGVMKAEALASKKELTPILDNDRKEPSTSELPSCAEEPSPGYELGSQS